MLFYSLAKSRFVCVVCFGGRRYVRSDLGNGLNYVFVCCDGFVV